MIMTLLLQGQADVTKNFTSTIESTVSAEDVWKILTDVSQWKLWDKDVIDAKYGGPIREKGIGTLIMASGKLNEFKITAVEEGTMYTFKHKLSSGMLFIKRTVASVDKGSRITEEVWYKGISGKTFKKYYGEGYTTTIQTKLEALKALMEG